MDETDLMFLEAFEDLKPYWDPKDGDIIYFEYSEKDKEFWKKKYEEAGKVYEPEDGWWFVDSNVEFKNDGTDRYSKYLKGKAKAWRARQEDLQEIYKEEQDCNFDYMLSEFGKFIDNGPWIYYNDFHVTDFNQAWLCFIMETCFQKEWNGTTWEAI
jgi:hypothetical protein